MWAEIFQVQNLEVLKGSLKCFFTHEHVHHKELRQKRCCYDTSEIIYS